MPHSDARHLPLMCMTLGDGTSLQVLMDCGGRANCRGMHASNRIYSIAKICRHLPRAGQSQMDMSRHASPCNSRRRAHSVPLKHLHHAAAHLPQPQAAAKQPAARRPAQIQSVHPTARRAATCSRAARLPCCPFRGPGAAQLQPVAGQRGCCRAAMQAYSQMTRRWRLYFAQTPNPSMSSPGLTERPGRHAETRTHRMSD